MQTAYNNSYVEYISNGMMVCQLHNMFIKLGHV